MIPESIRRTDSRLVRQALRGRRDSFNRLVERHMSGVYAVALARTQNHADAEDVVQEAFINAYTSLDKLREPASFGGWVATIARNTAVKLRARRTREAGSVQANVEMETVVLPDPSQAELQELLRNKLANLDDDAREVLLMHYFAGDSARIIADRLEISRDAALKRLQRAREKLAKAVIDEIEGAVREREPDLRKRSRLIASAIAATTVPWQVRKAGATSVFAPKLVIGAFVFTAAMALVFLATRGGGNEPSPSPQSEPVAVANTATPEPPPQDAAPAEEPVETPETDSQPALEPETEDVVEDEMSLDGVWTLHQMTEYTSTRELAASAVLDITQVGKRITVSEFGSQPLRAGQFEGTLEGGWAVFDLYDIMGVMWGMKPSAAELTVQRMMTGPINTTRTQIVLVGEYPITIDAESRIPQLSEVRAVLNKMNEDTAEDERAVQAAKVEAKTIRDAVVAYAYDHNGKLPRTLEVLVPRYIDSLSDVADNESRSFHYNSEARDIMSASRPLSELDGFRPGLDMRTRLLRWEADRAALFGERFPAPVSLLQVRVGKTPIEVHASFHGDPEVIRPDRATFGRTNTDDPEWAQRGNIEICQNQLKQLGLAIVMFWNMTDDQYNPPGWLTLVPEFIDTPAMLTCPTHGRGTMSYRIAFPAASRDQLTAIYADVHGVDPYTAAYPDVAGAIPAAYEEVPHEVGGRSIRNVLYLDGHVSSYTDEDWNRLVAPYLQYSVQ